MSAISSEHREWIRPDLVGVVTVVGSDGLPELARVWGARVAENSDVIEVDLQRAAAAGLIAALRAGSRAAVNLIELPSYRSRTFKGSCELSPTPPDPTLVDQRVAAAQGAMGRVGMPNDTTTRILSYSGGLADMVTLRITIDGIFDQSPKPGAGGPL